MARTYQQIGPNRWAFVNDYEPRRSDLPLPYVISDQMEPLEQVDGKFYTSKRAFRAVGKAHGLVEVGNEKIGPKQRSSNDRAVKEQRRRDIKTAMEKYAAGHRAGRAP